MINLLLYAILPLGGASFKLNGRPVMPNSGPAYRNRKLWTFSANHCVDGKHNNETCYGVQNTA